MMPSRLAGAGIGTLRMPQGTRLLTREIVLRQVHGGV